MAVRGGNRRVIGVVQAFNKGADGTDIFSPEDEAQLVAFCAEAGPLLGPELT